LEEADQLITSIKNIMQMDVASVRRLAANQTRASAAINPIVTDNELQAIIETTFKQISASVQSVKKIEISQSKHLYTCLATQYGKSQRLFANVIARPPVCSDCHDIHFIYVFDSTGIVLEIVNLQLTKWGNEPWDAADMAKMRGRLIGRSLRSPFIFNPSVDAVSSATITSAMIFNSLSQGNQLLKALQVGGWL
jgi:hypothetical protein